MIIRRRDLICWPVAFCWLLVACTERANAVFPDAPGAGWENWVFAGGLVILLIAVLVMGYRWRIRSLEAHRFNLLEQLAERTEALDALNQITAALSQSSNLHTSLTDALEKTLHVVKVESGGIYLLDERSGLLNIAAHSGLGEEFISKIDHLKVGEGFSGRVVQSGQPLVVKDIAGDPRLTRLAVAEAGLRSMAIAPLISKGKTLGTLFAITRGYHEFDYQEVELLASIGQQIGVALENAHLYEETRQKLAQLIALQKTNQAVVSTLDLDQLLNLIIQQATTLLRADGGILNLVEWENLEDEVYACTGSTSNVRGVRCNLESSLSGWVTLHNQAVISNQVNQDPRVDPRLHSGLFQHPLHNVAAAPLSIKERVIGTLVVVDKLSGAGEFEQADLDLLVAFANQAAAAIENARLYIDVQRKAEQFRVIAEVGRRLTLILDVDEVLRQVVRLIQKAFGYYHIGIGLVEEDKVVYRFGAGVLWDNSDFQFTPAALKVGAEGITGWVAASGEPLLAPDVEKEPRYVCMQGSAARSELTVPIIVKERVIGVLDAQSDRLNAFDETDLAVLQSLAHQAGTAIENARLFHAEQRRAEQFRVIGLVGQQIISGLDEEELLEQVARLVQAAFGYYHVGIGLIEGDEIVSKAEIGAFADAYANVRLKLGQGCWGWVAQHGVPLLLPDVRNDERYLYNPQAAEVCSAVCVPLKTKDAVIGVLSAENDRYNAFDESDLLVLQSLAHQAAVAVENIRYYERAQQLAVSEERNRLARELHDAVTQTLFSASLLAEALPATWEQDPQGGRQLLQELRGLSRGALAEMRTLLLELRPAALVETRLEDLLRQLGEAASGREGIPVSLLVEGSRPDGGAAELPSDVHIAFYRIAQEAFNNIVKHARASQVTVRFCVACTEADSPGVHPPASALLSIRDDGRGFDPALFPADRLGLGIMHERAQAIGASLTIDSHPGEGTQVTLLWEQGEMRQIK